MYLQTWTTSGSEVNTKSKETVFQVKSPIMVQHGEKRIHLWLSLYKHIISCYVKQIILYYFTLNFLYNHLFNVILTFKIDCKYIIRGDWIWRRSSIIICQYNLDYLFWYSNGNRELHIWLYLVHNNCWNTIWIAIF